MIGLEIHQRLNTKKLFCNCSGEKSEEYIKIIRKLHPVSSETGEYDVAALEEYKKNKVYEYIFYKNKNCLVEIDEEPPHEMRKEAILIAIEVAKQLNMDIVEQIHVMRKIVIDGSNTTGFQRTAIIGLDGYINTSKGKVRITSLALEEESAGIIKKEANKNIYSLDRLGIPLIEITTAPDIKDGEHLKEVAEKIGLILRTTGKVRRGIGSIRQDINISIPKGARVEIKGAQDLKMLKKIVEYEINRQKKLIEINKKNIDKVEFKMYNLTNVFKRTDSRILKNKQIFGIKLPGYKGILGISLGPNRRFGSELSDYAKTMGVKGIIHSDEDLKKYKIKDEEIKNINNLLNLDKSDAFVLVATEKEITAEKALRKVVERVNMKFIPKETRKVNQNGTTSYMRPLPGNARMYPETDIPPIETKDLVEKITIKESYEEKINKLEKMLNKDMAKKIIKSRYFPLFESFIKKGYDPKIVAITLEQTIKTLKREGYHIDLSLLDRIFYELKKGNIVKKAIPEILKIANKNNINECIKKFSKITGKELEKIVIENKLDVKNIMKKYSSRIDSKELFTIISKLST